MDMNTFHAHGQELENYDVKYESFYAELETQILILTDDHDETGFPGRTQKHTSSSLIAKQRSTVMNQPERYFCWTEKNETGDKNPVPTWLLDLWRNNNNGTGVFLPRIENSRRKSKPRRINNNKGRIYKPVVN